MKTMKNFLVVFCVVLAVACNSSENEQYEKFGDLNWKLSADGTLTINGKGVMPDYRSVSTDKPWAAMPWYDRRDKITSVIIGDDVSNIGWEAFFQCSNLANVVIGKSVDSIGNGAFGSCSSLTAIDIPGSVTKIGAGAFGESGLKSVVIPNSVTYIDDLAFADCSSLTTIFIANSVASIGAQAFRCHNLNEIVNYRKIPQIVIMKEYPGGGPHHPGGGTQDTFNRVDKTNCILFVPAESIDAYRAAEGWNEFVNIKAIQ